MAQKCTTVHRIAAADLQPGQVIRHTRTRATTGDYEVVNVKAVCGGATSIRIKATSQQGVKFNASVLYDAEELVEVVSK